jgi:hypothetical protein
MLNSAGGMDVLARPIDANVTRTLSPMDVGAHCG